MSKNLAVLILCGSLALPAQAAEITGRAQIIDGGTLQIGNAMIELHGIDAPDPDQFCELGSRAYQCGQEASWALAERIERHWVLCVEEGAGRNAGRVAATCYIGGRNGIDLSAHMVRQGWALADRERSMRYVNEEAEAQRARRGMWAGSFDPPASRRSKGQ